MGVASRLPEVLLLTKADELKDVVGEWLALAQCLDGSSYFQTPDWVLSWWESTAAHPPTEIAIWRDRSAALEALVAISRVAFPLAEWAPFVADIWANTGFGTGADHCGWPVLPQRVEEVRRWLIRRTAGTTLVLFGMDPQTGVALVPPGARRLTRYTCPRLEFQPTDGRQGAPVKHHRRLEQQRKKFLKMGVVFRPISAGRTDDQVLKLLFTLHEQRFRAKGVRCFFTRDRLELHRRLITRSAPGRGPCAMIAEYQGQPIGIEYGFWWRDVYYSHQSGWDPSWAKTGVGKVLLNEMMRFVHSAGGRAFDFAHGTESIKYYFGGQDRWDETWILPRGLTGRVIIFKYSMDERLQRYLPRPIAKFGERIKRPSVGADIGPLDELGVLGRPINVRDTRETADRIRRGGPRHETRLSNSIRPGVELRSQQKGTFEP